MTIYLGDGFFRAVERQPLEYEYQGRRLVVEKYGSDLLHIREGGEPVAYITRYTESESGILPAGWPTDVLAPIFSNLDDALASLRLAPPA